MAARSTSTVQLFPCSERVQVPSPGVSSARTKSFSTNEYSSGSLFSCNYPPFTPPARKRRHNRFRSEGARRTNRQITELGSQLSFRKDVVLSQCPEAITYQEAKQHMRQLCRAEWLPQERKNYGVRFNVVDVGRHDVRGTLKMHKPCLPPLHIPHHIKHPLPPIRTIMSPYQQSLMAESDIYSTGSAKDWIRRMWEKAVLFGVSQSTARGFVSNAKGTDKQRLSETLNQLEENGLDDIDTVGTDDEGDQQLDEAVEKGTVSVAPSFLFELQQGATIVHQREKRREETVLLSNNARFEKVLQPSYPQVPQEWLSTRKSGKDGKEVEDKVVRGQQRWVALPKRAQTPLDMQWIIREPVDDTFDKIQEHSSLEQVAKTKSEELLDIANDLLNKWHVRVQPQDVCEEFVLKNLPKISGNVKMRALGATTALLTSFLKKMRKKSDELVHLGTKATPPPLSSMVSEEMMQALSQAVRCEIERVVVVSAVILIAMERDKEKSLEVLRAVVEDGSTAEQWAAVQCLAVDGEATPLVLGGLMALKLTLNNPQRLHRSSQLLVRLSKLTPMVQAMVTEQLNGITWQERKTACHLLAQLHGGINKDVCGRLVTMVWNDWSPEVKTAAAQALGQTGHGKMVHDEIERKIKHTDSNTKLDALKQLRSLRLMTSYVKPVFLQCFKDEHTSVKLEAIHVAEELKLVDTQIVLALQGLLHDPFWKVKAHAIRALGAIGLLTEDLLKDLLWIVRFERMAALRAEGCLALATLGVRNSAIEETLRELLAVDNDPLVLSEARKALVSLGYGSDVPDAMAEAVRSEVRRLGSQDVITEQVVNRQHMEIVDYVLQRPKNPLSTRDYLTDDIRQKVFSLDYSKLDKAVDNIHSEMRTWSPDRTTIEKYLNITRKNGSRHQKHSANSQ